MRRNKVYGALEKAVVAGGFALAAGGLRVGGCIGIGSGGHISIPGIGDTYNFVEEISGGDSLPGVTNNVVFMECDLDSGDCWCTDSEGGYLPDYACR